jgi:23S rRNA pseudouridine955/2504/2580 synthase
MTWHNARHSIVDPEYAGQRLDNYLIARLKSLPKTRIYRMIRSGEVRLNGKRVAAQHRLEGGEDLRIPPLRDLVDAKRHEEGSHEPSKPARNALASNSPSFPVLFEDEALLVINKPAGIAVHGGSGISRGLIEWLRLMRPELVFLELGHRLDRETSGVLVLAKRRAALLQLHRAFRERVSQKHYIAVVSGRVPKRDRVLRHRLQRHRGEAGERIVRVEEEGLEAVSVIRGLGTLEFESPPSLSTVLVRIETGRTHQIRVHLAHEGYPILGDERYGDFSLNRQLKTTGLKRMLLHAWQLELAWPQAAGGRLRFIAPVPLTFKPWACGLAT